MRAFLFQLVVFLFVALAGATGIGGVAATFAIAQSSADINYDAWNIEASRAEKVLEEQRASSLALEDLRTDIVEWRTRFLGEKEAHLQRTATVRRQLLALGTVPAEGSEEAPEIVDRRDQLVAQLSQLDAPQRRADEAYSRADGIIREIDTIIRDRQAQQIFKIGPSPLNPAHWSDAFSRLNRTLTGVRQELVAAWNSRSRQKDLQNNLPATLFLFAFAVVMLGRGRHWMERLTLWVQGRGGTSGPGQNLRAFMVSIGQVAVPVLGIILMTAAVFSTKLLGFRGQIVVEALPIIGMAFYAQRWLATRLFPISGPRTGVLGFEPAQQRELRMDMAFLGLLFGIAHMQSQIAAFENYPDSVRAVLSFPTLVLTAFLLVRGGTILKRGAKAAEDAVEDGQTLELRVRLAGTIGKIMVVAGFSGVLAAMTGYSYAANLFIYPMVRTLWLIGFVLVLQVVARDLYRLATGAEEKQTQEALIPVLVDFLLILLATPLFALIWGARVSDLTEIWARFLKGFTFGDTHISPTDFLTFAIVFVIGYGLTRLVQGGLRSTVLPKTSIDIGGQTALVSGVGYIGIFLASVVAISTAGIDLSSLAIVAGALSVGIGFGLQTIVSNFVSGIILLVERPISEGDWIEVGDNMGYVRDISVRATRIETFDRTDVIIPNSDLVSGTVTNYTRGNSIGRVIVPVGVAYGTDTHKVAAILQEIAEANKMVVMRPPPAVHFSGFGADSLDFEIRAILRDVNFILNVKTEINHEIARRFAEEGIEIPFAQRDVWLRNPEALQATPPKKSKTPVPKKTTSTMPKTPDIPDSGDMPDND